MYPSTPSGWQKSVVFKWKPGEWERGKNAQRAITTDTEVYCWFPSLQSCQTATVPGWDYLQKPHVSHFASSDDMTRDLCVAACCLQNSWRQNPSFLIPNSWQDLESDSTTCCQLPTKELEESSEDAAFPEFSSLCKKLLLRGSHTEPPAWDSAVFPLPHQSEIVCLVLWNKGS